MDGEEVGLTGSVQPVGRDTHNASNTKEDILLGECPNYFFKVFLILLIPFLEFGQNSLKEDYALMHSQRWKGVEIYQHNGILNIPLI